MKTLPKDRLESSLWFFLAWLNDKDAPSDDFRKLTALVVRMSPEAEKVSLGYAQNLRWDRKIDPLCRRIAERFPAYSVPMLLRERLSDDRDTQHVELRPLRKNLRNSSDLQACRAIGYLFDFFRTGVLRQIHRCELRTC